MRTARKLQVSSDQAKFVNTERESNRKGKGVGKNGQRMVKGSTHREKRQGLSET